MKRLLIALCLLSSCSALKTLETKTTVKDSTSYKNVYVPIEVKGSSVSQDNLAKLLAEMRAEQRAGTNGRDGMPGAPGKVVYRTIKDDNGVQLQFKLDDEGRFRADCAKKDSMMNFLVREAEHWRKESKTIVMERTPSLWDNIKQSMEFIIVASVLCGGIFLLIKGFFFRG